MFTILLAIFNAILSTVSVMRFFADKIVYLAHNVSWAASQIGSLPDLFPDFLKPFLLIGLALAVLSIFVKLI